jgi:glucose-6-phosphate 1-epimerase
MSHPFSACQTRNNGERGLENNVAVTYLSSIDGATAVVADHGAHVLSWCPAGKGEALFLSTASRYGVGTAIRGGVPVIFPQFGEMGSGRRHGFVRNLPWQFLEADLQDGTARARWELTGNFPAQTLAQLVATKGQQADFTLQLDVQINAQALVIGLTIVNTSGQAWHCHAALHSYLRVNEVAQSWIEGLQHSHYLDQSDAAPLPTGAPSSAGTIDPAQLVPQLSPQLRFECEIDRIYVKSPSHLILRESARYLRLEQQGFLDTVIWNPGAPKAAALKDLVAGDQQQFICIEAATIAQPLYLKPAALWRGTQRFSIAS